MIVWRICRAPFADLSGTGARLMGGRWNSRGRAVVYAAADAALTVLEVRVHLDLPPDLIPDDYVLMAIDCGDAAVGSLDRLDDEPADRGDDWLERGATPLLSVPSFIIPESRNILINPRHADAAAIRIDHIRPFRFDERLWTAPGE